MSFRGVSNVGSSKPSLFDGCARRRRAERRARAARASAARSRLDIDLLFRDIALAAETATFWSSSDQSISDPGPQITALPQINARWSANHCTHERSMLAPQSLNPNICGRASRSGWMGEAKRRSTQYSVLVTQYTQYSVVGTQYSILRSIVWQLCCAWSLVVAAAVCLIIFGGFISPVSLAVPGPSTAVRITRTAQTKWTPGTL